jgi:hypothetical protein
MRFRKLRIAWSVVMGIACVLMIVLWVRSFRTFDRTSGRLLGSSYVLVSYAGRLTAVAPGFFGEPNWDWPRWDCGPVLPKNLTFDDMPKGEVDWSDADMVWPYRGTMGFSWIYKTSYFNIPKGEVGWGPRGLSARSLGAVATGVMLPHSLVVLVFASLAVLSWVHWSSRFSLRTLLIATTLVAVVLGLAVWEARK